MDPDPDVPGHGSAAKRARLDADVPAAPAWRHDGAATPHEGYSNFLHPISADCDSADSGYEASTMESIPTSSVQASPHTDAGDLQESLSSLSETYLQTPTHILDQLETSQDSLEVEDDNVSTVSHLSELSGLSDLSGQDWKPMAGSMVWVRQQMQKGVDPRMLLTELGVDLVQIPQYMDDGTLWKIIRNMLAEPPRRNKLRHVNTLDDVVRLLRGAQNVIVLTGAGVSVSCGIPDFRSRDGIYSRLAIDFPNLPDPQAMFDISYFMQDPRPFFKFARDIYPGKFQPSPCHRFIKLLERQGRLLRNYTQNIDTLEKVANIDRVIECHGSFATATCTWCHHKTTADRIRNTILEQKIPLCEVCHCGKESSVSTNDSLTGEAVDYRELVMSGIMKPDIVFFGEGLPDTFHEAMAADKQQCDLLLVIGSSLKVRPVALIPSSLPAHVPQILINREPLPHCRFDVELLGDCDVIINHLCQVLGNQWSSGIFSDQTLSEAPHLLKDTFSDLDSKSPTPLEINSPHREQETTIIPSISPKCECTMSTIDFECSCITKTSINSDDDVNSSCYKNKERHMSIDSARDSGIGENSNLTDAETDTEHKNYNNYNMDVNEPSCSRKQSAEVHDLRGFWQPKIKRSVAERLPHNSYYFVAPNRYIFPGAEVYYDPDEKSQFYGNSDSDSTDSESDRE